MMVTWLLAGLWLWAVLTKPGTRVAWICKKLADASDHIRSRVWYMYQNIPPEYAKPRAEFSNGNFLVYHDEASWRNRIPTSRIVAVAAERGATEEQQTQSAASQLRSQTWSGIVWDEAAFDRHQDEIYGSALPSVDGGGVFNIMSSANGENFFCILGHGDINTLQVAADYERAIPKQELLRGLLKWERNGFTQLRVHYSADRDKDRATAAGKRWYAETRPRYTQRKWDREMEISFSVPAGVPVYFDTERIETLAQFYRPGLVLVRNWDFGWACNACVFFQVERVWAARRGEDERTRRRRDPDEWSLRILFEVVRTQRSLLDVAREVLDETDRLFPAARVVDFGDPAGQAHDLKGESAIKILESAGITCRTWIAPKAPEGEDLYGIEVVQHLIRRGWVGCDPQGAPMTLKALRGGYARDDHGRPIKDGVFEHPADALRYGVINVVRLQRAGTGGDILRPADGWRGGFLAAEARRGGGGTSRATGDGVIRPGGYRGR